MQCNATTIPATITYLHFFPFIPASSIALLHHALYILGSDPSSITTNTHLFSLCFSFMANSFTKAAGLSLTFFLLHFFSTLPIHARELTSFSKAVQNEYPSDTATKTQEITTPLAAAGGEQPEKLPQLGRNGYGLYGRGGPDEYFPTTTSSSTNYYNGFNGERSRPPRTEFSAESYDNREANPAYKSYGERQKNREQLDSMSADEARRGERYGMSDTRAAENGKYFYSLNAQRHDAFDPAMAGSEVFGVKDGSFGYGVYNYEGKGKGHGHNQALEGHQNYHNQEINRVENYEP